MPLLGIPLWAWLTGGAVVGTAVVIDQAGDTAQQMGDAAEKSTDLVKWAAIGGAIFVAYKVLK